MKKIILILCAIFIVELGFSQTRKLSLETPPTDNRPELVVQEGNNGGIKYLKYSNDGKYIMSATDIDAKVYERETGILIKSFNLLLAFKDFSPNARFIVSCSLYSNDRRIFLTNIETREEVVIGTENDSDSKTYSFSPDGKYLAVPNTDYIDIYDMETLKKQFVLSNSGYYFYKQVAWSADCRYLSILASAAKGKNATINIVYDRLQNKIIKVFDKYKGKNQLFLTAISPDASYIAYAVSSTVHIESVFSNSVDKSFSMSDEYGKKPLGLNFSYDGKQLYALKEYYLRTYDMNTWKTYNSKRTNSAYSFALLTHRGNEFAIGTFQDIEICDYDTWKIKETISGISHWTQISRTDNGNIFVSDASGRATALFAPNFEKLPQSESLTKNIVSRHLAFSNVGLYYSDYKNKKIFLRDLENNKNSVILKNISAEMIITSTKGNLLAIYDDEKKESFVYDVKKKKKSVVQGLESGFYPNTDSFSSFESFVCFQVIGDNNKYIVYDLKKNKIVLVFETTNAPNFSFNEKYLAIPSDTYTVDVYDTKTWTIVKTFGDDSASFFYPFFSSDNKYIGMYELNIGIGKCFISVHSVYNWKVVKKISVRDIEPYMYFNADSSQIIAMGAASIIRCYLTETGELLSSTIGDAKGDWLTYTPEGYFNGSEGGINKFVHLVNGMEVSELGRYAETLFRPDLVAAKIRGEDISKEEGTISLAELVSTGEAPLVSFVNPPATSNNRDITVNFNVQDMGGGVGSVYLKINGKVIQLADGSRKLELVGGSTSTTQKSSGKTTQFSHLLTLQNGENTLEAYAYNSAGKIESLHATATITWQGKTAKPNLYVLAVGVNKYRDKSLWLNYAVPDATSIADSFRGVKGNLYQSVNVTTVFDGDVTSSGIATAFNLIAGKVSADDVFIFYLSGHGTTHTDGDYYFIPVDFRFRNAQSVPETAVSKHFITEQLSKIKAQKTLVMLDTCNSGAFISTGARGMAEKTAIDRLSRATGQATIAASSDTQSAMEGYNGHGIFTYVILEGLSGKADTNKDGYVSLSELSSYAEEKVPDYSYAKWGYEQYPQVDLRKQSNFPLVGK